MLLIRSKRDRHNHLGFLSLLGSLIICFTTDTSGPIVGQQRATGMIDLNDDVTLNVTNQFCFIVDFGCSENVSGATNVAATRT
jgi:hypothetical protein